MNAVSVAILAFLPSVAISVGDALACAPPSFLCQCAKDRGNKCEKGWKRFLLSIYDDGQFGSVTTARVLEPIEAATSVRERGALHPFHARSGKFVLGVHPALVGTCAGKMKTTGRITLRFRDRKRGAAYRCELGIDWKLVPKRERVAE